MVNLKKLIAGFLVLASLAGFGTLIFFNISSRESLSKETAKTPKPLIQAPPFAAVGQNAFVEKIPETKTSTFIQPPSGGSYNFTEELAQNLAQEFITANPNGPTELDGGLALISPDDRAMESMVKRITNDLNNLEGKLFNTESIPDGEIKIVKNYTQADTLNYLNSLTNITEGVIRSRIEGLDKQVADSLAVLQGGTGAESVTSKIMDATNASRLVFDEAIQNLKSLSVPAPLTRPHKAMIQALDNQKKIVDAVANIESDPAKIALITREDIDKMVNRDIQNFIDELEKSSGFDATSGLEKNSLIASIKNFFLVNQAKAFIGGIGPSAEDLTTAARTGSAATDAGASVGNFLQRLLQWAKQLATELLKEQIMGQLINRIIAWVQGGGQGRIIDNWQTFFSNAFDRAAGFTIEKIVPGLCQSFGPLIKLSLQQIQNLPVTETRCTLSQVVQNISSFYNNFLDRGVQLGWASYGSLIKFENNFYGASILAHDAVISQAAAAAQTAEAEAQTARGFLSTKVCPSGTTKIGENLCSDGSVPFVTTPGGTIASSIDSALGADIHRIVNSTDVIALASALINSALNRLVQAGVNGLRGI